MVRALFVPFTPTAVRPWPALTESRLWPSASGQGTGQASVRGPQGLETALQRGWRGRWSGSHGSLPPRRFPGDQACFSLQSIFPKTSREAFTATRESLPL